MRVLAISPFLNEARYLPRFLTGLAAQQRPPDLHLLVDDGSTDGSAELTGQWAAAHGWARVLRRPPRPPERDRLAFAAELKAFQWALAQPAAEGPWDVVVKLDADLVLPPSTFARMVHELEQDPRLGIVGPYLAVGTGPRGALVRESAPPWHVRGAVKFYRRQTLDEISPVEPVLGWDTADDIEARRLGWRTRSVALDDGDVLHLRPVGTGDGALQGYRRWGTCAWGYGAHPLHVLAGTARRLPDRPVGVAALNYLWGYVGAALRHAPRARAEVRAHGRREQLARLRGRRP